MKRKAKSQRSQSAKRKSRTANPSAVSGHAPPLRPLTADDLGPIGWTPCAPGEFRIVAELTCADCGAYQAADCDPTPRQNAALRMTVRLFNAVGWRSAGGRPLCPACAAADPRS